jgi:hypothetical protein
MAAKNRIRHPAILAILTFFVGAELIGAGQYTFVRDKLAISGGSAYYDVILKGGDGAGRPLTFHVLTAVGSPPSETLLRVAEFSDHRLSTIDQLFVTGVDATGVGVRLHRIRLSPADVAEYEQLFAWNSANGDSGDRIAKQGMPFFREFAMSGMLSRRAGSLKVVETDFRLPPPPTVWTWKGGLIGRLDFRLESAGGASVKAVLITPAAEK